jgi:hypothetical protein
MLMVVAVGLLIAPAIHHRMVEDGNATTPILRRISALMGVALLPLAVSLGINVFVALESLAGTGWAFASGLVAGGLALWFWFGLEWLAVAQRGGKHMRYVNEQISLSKKIDQMLTEARVILPGAQALLGFQLAVVLTEAFEQLPPSSKAAHAAALGCVALSTILLMAPAAYHRIVYGGEASRQFHDLGSRFIMAATLALALGLATDVHVVIGKIAGSSLTGLVAGAVSLVLLASMWHISPLVLQRMRTSCRRTGAESSHASRRGSTLIKRANTEKSAGPAWDRASSDTIAH